MTAARETALALAEGAAASLGAARARIDDLNVYPVPDGDTGSNLLHTVEALVAGLRESDAEAPAALARAATRAALMGARGNSGIILSQIVRGVADGLGAVEGAVDAAALARCLRGGSDWAYRAVRQPVEGTMLTAIRAMAEAAEAHAGGGLHEALDAVLAAGERAVEETPTHLAVLREAGVVDAGAAGLVECYRGAIGGLRGAVPEAPAAALAGGVPADAVHVEKSRYRYCTTFVVEGEVDADELERRLAPLGDSLLVVGAAPAYRVHVHTDQPGEALTVGVALGEVEGVQIANMHRQTAERTARLSARPPLAAVRADPPRTGLVAVVAGAGNEAVFRAEGAEVVAGGQSMNPSTEDILAAVRATGARSVVVLPNNRNVVLAAEHAAREAGEEGIRTSVVPTASIAAGLAALVAYGPGDDHDAAVAAMGDAVAAVRCGELVQAIRDATVDGRRVRAGEWLGLAGRTLAGVGDDPRAVAAALLDALLAEGGEVVTLVRGERDAFPVDAFVAELEGAHPDVEVDVHAGGQPHYPLLVAVE